MKNLSNRKGLKTWQFWIPRMGGFSYNIFYVPKFLRATLRHSNYMFKMTYPNKGDYLYTIPSGIVPSLVKRGDILFSVGNKPNRYKLKPYLTAILINILGLTFRFKVFLRVKGLGYKAYVLNAGKTLSMKLGLSHIVQFNFFRGMFATKLGQKDRMFSVEGDNWIILTNTVARIRSLRKVDYYRGKGIFKKFYTCKIRQGRKKKK